MPAALPGWDDAYVWVGGRDGWRAVKEERRGKERGQEEKRGLLAAV